MSGTIKPAPIVVLGATGAVGRGVVAAAAARGRPVIAVGRDTAALDALKAEHPHAALSTLPGSVASDADGARLAEDLRGLRRPVAGVVVAVCGQAERGRLLDQPAAFLQRKLDQDLLPHLAAARHLLPLLAESGRGGSYVLIGGPGSEHPWAGYGHRSIGAAALRMLARVLHDEARALAVRVQLLTVDTPICRRGSCESSSPQWPSALAVGQRALALVDQTVPAAPAQAVVRYAPREQTASHPILSLKGKASTAAIDVADTSSVGKVPADEAAPPADAIAAPLPPRCLDDARALLDSFLSPNRNQDPSP